MPGSRRKNCYWWNTAIEKVVEARLPRLLRYLGAMGIALAGVASAYGISGFVEPFPSSIAVLATAAAAIFGGLGPGLLAAAVGAFGVEAALGAEAFSWSGLIRIFVFGIVSCLVSFFVYALRDTFERAEAAKVEAELANSEKDAVMEFLSHDLRGPLSSISLGFQLIHRYVEAGGRETEIRRLSSGGAALCRKMSRLIQNLLDASRIRSDGISLHPEVSDLRALAGEVCQENRLAAEEKQVRFSCESTEEEAITVNGDRLLLVQAISNLVQNSFKFTPPGGSVKILTKKDGRMACLQVVDTGSGIPAGELEHIFDKFWQGRKGLGEGMGLGLFISRAIVEAHRGEIHVESATGEGSVFTIFLPAGRETQAADPVSLRRKRVA